MDLAKIRKQLQGSKEARRITGDEPEQAPPADARTKEPPKADIAPPVEEEKPEDIETREDYTEKKTAAMPELAAPAGAEDIAGEMVELLVFKLSNEDYAFKVSDIEEILRPQNVTTVPRVQDFILGVTSLRGKVIPLLDLKKRLALTGDGEKPRAKVLILKGAKGSVGVLVDRVVDVLRVPGEAIVEPPQHLSESELKYIEGVVVEGGRFISIIRIEDVLDFGISEAGK